MNEFVVHRLVRLLDLFCGAGGAAVGYDRAGFEVVGIDIHPQPRYPFRFLQADALTALDDPSFLRSFDVVHASPPCQAYSALKHLGKQGHMPRFYFVEKVRERLEAAGVQYVIENVVGAPLNNSIMLCGQYFGLKVRRHRLFESNAFCSAPECKPYHKPGTVGVYGDHPQISKGMNRAHTLAQARAAMGIEWMNWHELCEAIPPAYTEYLGRQLIAQLRNGMALCSRC
jgi:DNA (cytosine-5)-methyltransferase 1